MRVVIAPDSFKGSIAASGAAAAIADGWRSVRPDDELVLLPQADGGEGTLEAISAASPDAVFRPVGGVTGPDGLPVDAAWLELPGGTAVVELARSSGLALMRSLDPLGATTRGLGEVIAAALDAGGRDLVIGLGGSASTDGGAGALAALGDRRPAGIVTLLTDVTAPLLGPTGAAAVFAPQKGASPADVAQLEQRMRDWAARFPAADPDTPGAGAAGGTAFGFLAAWGARIEPGAAAIAELTALTAALENADVLITGEGRFDATSLTGKVVGYALRAAEAAGVARVIALAGQVALAMPSLAGATTASLSLSELAGSTEAALADPAGWLFRAGGIAAAQLEA
jgi:glycerate 2-kinase